MHIDFWCLIKPHQPYPQLSREVICTSLLRLKPNMNFHHAYHSIISSLPYCKKGITLTYSQVCLVLLSHLKANKYLYTALVCLVPKIMLPLVITEMMG